MPTSHRTDVEDWYQVMNAVGFTIADTPILTAPFPVNMPQDERHKASPDVPKPLQTRIACDGFYLRLLVTGGSTAAINIQCDIFNAWYPTIAEMDTDAVAGYLLPVSAVATWRRTIDVQQAVAGMVSRIKFTRLDSNTGDLAVSAWIKRYRHIV